MAFLSVIHVSRFVVTAELLVCKATLKLGKRKYNVSHIPPQIINKIEISLKYIYISDAGMTRSGLPLGYI